MKNQHDRYIEKISTLIRALDEIPLFGNASPLNLEDLSELLATQLGIPDLTVRVKGGQWKEKELKGKWTPIPIVLSPINEPIYWVMSKADKEKLTAFFFSNNKKKVPITQSLQDGFYRYLLLEALSAASTLEPIQQMSLLLGEEGNLPEEDTYTFDVEISSSDFTVWGKCLITNSFRKDWVQHFSAFPPRYTPTELARALPVEIGLKVGSVQLLLSEWENLKIGDVIIPDILANNERGTLVFDHIPLFQIHLHGNQIELLDYAINLEDSMDESEITPVNSLAQKLETFEKETKSIKEIPLHISVELARLKIPLDQLMALSPGNFLELPTLADKTVSLIANGQKIGVAELVQLGETLGLKVLEI